MVILFGPTNVLCSFKKYINKIFRKYKDIFYVFNLINILIYRKKLNEYCEHLRIVINVLEKSGLLKK